MSKRVLLESARGKSVDALALIESEKAKHLRKVLRLEWGDPIFVTDGAGRTFEARLEKAGEQAGARIVRLIDTASLPSRLELVLCLAKNSVSDSVVEKAVECGMTLFTPVISARSVVRAKHEDAKKYTTRWQAIADGAVEQSESAWRVNVSDPIDLVQWLKQVDSTVPTLVFSSELRSKLSVQETAAKISEYSRSGLRIVIGPEGGFSEEEIHLFRQAGFGFATLGDLVLRVETAAVAALMWVQIEKAKTSDCVKK